MFPIIPLIATLLSSAVLAAPVPRPGQSAQVQKRSGYGAYINGTPLSVRQRIAIHEGMEEPFLDKVRHGNVLAPRPMYPDVPPYYPSGALYGQ